MNLADGSDASVSELGRAAPDERPEISVVMPAHQAEAYVGDAIASILGQTWRDFELIVAVDASTDATERIARKAARDDPRIRVLVVDEKSVSRTRNRAIDAARGRYVALMDADDVAYSDRLERQRAAIEAQPNIVLVGCWMRRVSPEGLPMEALRAGPTDPTAFYELDRTRSLIRLYGTVAFFRRELCEQLGGFDPRFEPMEDAELWDRMADHGVVVVLPRILQDYRQHEQSLSVRFLSKQREIYRFITRRHAARLEGRMLPSWEAFDQHYRRRSKLWEIDDRLRGASMRFARSARIARARGRVVPAAARMLLAVLTHPYRFLRRLFPGAPHV